jgi:hypothetical protein
MTERGILDYRSEASEENADPNAHLPLIKVGSLADRAVNNIA